MPTSTNPFFQFYKFLNPNLLCSSQFDQISLISSLFCTSFVFKSSCKYIFYNIHIFCLKAVSSEVVFETRLPLWVHRAADHISLKPYQRFFSASFSHVALSVKSLSRNTDQWLMPMLAVCTETMLSQGKMEPYHQETALNQKQYHVICLNMCECICEVNCAENTRSCPYWVLWEAGRLCPPRKKCWSLRILCVWP